MSDGPHAARDAVVAATPAIVVERLSVTVHDPGGPRLLLREVSLAVARGEVVGITGPSGAGKSTLARAIVGTLPAHARVTGTIRVGSAAPDLGPRPAYVPQDAELSLDPHDRAERMLRRVAHARGGSIAIAEALAAVALPADVAIRRAAELSGGMARRLALALALVPGPDGHTGPVVADEPFAGLDPAAAADVAEALARACRARGGLIVGHELPWLLRLCTRLLVLDGGAVVDELRGDDMLAPLRDEPRSQRPAQAPAPGTAGTGTLRAPASVALLSAARRDQAARAAATTSTAATGSPADPSPSPAPQAAPRLRIAGVEVRDRSGRPRLRAADLAVALHPGAIVAVLGPSGVGKSTLLAAIVGLVRPCAGTLTWDGAAIADPRVLAQLRRATGVVWQDARASFDPHHSIAWALGRAAALAGRSLPQPALARLAAEVGLDLRCCARRPAQLSTGELRRAALARALARQPALLLLDEPTAALDRPLAWALGEVVVQRARAGAAVLWAGHDEPLLAAVGAARVELTRP